MYELSIINEVHNYPLIYNKLDPDFRNKALREKAWQDISHNVGIAAEQCQARWRSLRDRFVKEINRKDIPEQRWKYFEPMYYLKDFVIKQPGFEESLISEIQKHACIYDRSNPDFTARISREEAWEDISNAIGKPVGQCQRRWKSLRDRFCIEINKSTSSNWYYFEAMQFMSEHVAQKRSLQSLVEETVDSNNYENDSSELSNIEETIQIEIENPLELKASTATGSKRKSMDDEPNDLYLKVMKKIETILENKFSNARQAEVGDPFHKYLESLLNKVDEDECENMKVEIINFVTKRIQEYRKQKKTNILN